jgi:acetyl esterase/lipase
MKAVALILMNAMIPLALAQAPPRTEMLWPRGVPGAVGTEDVDKPTLTIYLPASAAPTHPAVVVCPGGGYRNLAMDHEGKQIAEWLNARGIAAFVLKYRLGPRYHHPAMLDDVQQAIRTVRTRANQFNVAPDRIGVWGFSAGGHLASSAATHFATLDGVSSRPDFAILSYPVITMMEEQFVHKGSRENLLGKNFDPKLAQLMSSELQVTAQTPATFIFHTNADTGVPAENSVMFYLALRKAGVPAELHIFEKGRHGLGLAQEDPALRVWPVLLENWFRTREILPAAAH